LRWKEQCPDPSPEAFIFPNKEGDFMDTSNYRKRVLHKLAADLGLPKLTFQVIRRTIATLAQKKGTVKDVQGVLRHSRAATTTDVYMQEIPKSVQATVESINRELRKRSQPRAQRAENLVQEAMNASQIGSSQNGLTPNDTKRGRAMSVSD
jgi:integrase